MRLRPEIMRNALVIFLLRRKRMRVCILYRMIPRGFSGRELEILGLYARGLTTKEISGKLHISCGIVLSHVNHASRKLGVSRRVDAIRICLQRHLIHR
ncbi:response regulator transcription factor [Bifidobacterium merycicum]|uniref:response regulator transcription factor n=2 Tax=Bifidobacterium merycicum TaxID=78345 RepID=UPI000933E458|nr:helix-turn-helix transcriptional regulator [Bifidobacterium sp.]